MIEIPFTGAPKESVDVKIGGRKIEFKAHYANLMNSWTVSLFDRSTTPPTPLVQGVAVVMGVDLLQPYPLGLGSLFALPSADDRRDAGAGELGVRIKLVHVSKDEVEAILAEQA
ncbi:MAG: hypothetical protein R3F35_01665 [Myxococcota bacterium]